MVPLRRDGRDRRDGLGAPVCPPLSSPSPLCFESDCYAIRGGAPADGLSLVLLTFVATVPTILRDAEALINVSRATFIHLSSGAAVVAGLTIDVGIVGDSDCFRRLR